MNKYKKALDWLYTLALPCESLECYEHRKTFVNGRYGTLQELVDKQTPMKPEKRYYTSAYGNNGTKARVDIKCPHCKSSFINGVRSSIGVFQNKEEEFIETINNQKFCRFCSQAIDWSDEDA